MPAPGPWRFSHRVLIVSAALIAGVAGVGAVFDWFLVPFATAVAILIGAGLLRAHDARAALVEGEDVRAAVRTSLLVFVAALVALVITRVLIFMSFEFRITPPPVDDELAMVLAGQLRDEVIAEAISLVPGVVLFVLTWPSGTRSSAGSPG